MKNATDTPDDDMPDEIDFSNGVRGKFFKKDAELHVPVYLDAEVQSYLAAQAKAQGVEIDRLVNDLLKRDIEQIKAARL